jgi:hypothetical protein
MHDTVAKVVDHCQFTPFLNPTKQHKKKKEESTSTMITHSPALGPRRANCGQRKQR